MPCFNGSFVNMTRLKQKWWIVTYKLYNTIITIVYCMDSENNYLYTYSKHGRNFPCHHAISSNQNELQEFKKSPKKVTWGAQESATFLLIFVQILLQMSAVENFIVSLANENTENWKRPADLVEIANMRGKCWKLREIFHFEKGQIYRPLYGQVARVATWPYWHLMSVNVVNFWKHHLKPVFILFLQTSQVN